MKVTPATAMMTWASEVGEVDSNQGIATADEGDASHCDDDLVAQPNEDQAIPDNSANASTTCPQPGPIAKALFLHEFPQDRSEVVPTPAGDLECALYAIIKSMHAQYPQLVQPTIGQLRETLRNLLIKWLNQGFDVSNHNNLTVDQAQAVVVAWADVYLNPITIQLGTVIGGAQRGYLIPSLRPNDLVLWIYNDNASNAAASKTKKPSAVFCHYSGIRRTPEHPSSTLMSESKGDTVQPSTNAGSPKPKTDGIAPPNGDASPAAVDEPSTENNFTAIGDEYALRTIAPGPNANFDL